MRTTQRHNPSGRSEASAATQSGARQTFKLRWTALEPAFENHPVVAIVETLLDFHGPQIAIWSVDGTSYLGVASDDQGDVVRWIAAPVTEHELHAVKLGTMALRDVLSQSHAVVIDQDGDGEITLYGAISLADIPENAFPEHGAPLPSAVTAHYRADLKAAVGGNKNAGSGQEE